MSICRAARLGDAAFTKKEWMEEIYRQLPNGNAWHSYLPRPRNSERPALAPAPSPGRLAVALDSNLIRDSIHQRISDPSHTFNFSAASGND